MEEDSFYAETDSIEEENRQVNKANEVLNETYDYTLHNWKRWFNKRKN